MINQKFNPLNCPVGVENKTNIITIKEEIKEIKTSMDNGFKGINVQINELFNHQSNRLPPWITIIVSLLSSLVVGLSVFFLTRGI